MKFMRRLFCTVIMAGAMAAQAHDARPNYVQITEVQTHLFSVQWKSPATLAKNLIPEPVFPDDCIVDPQQSIQLAGAEYIGRRIVRCTSSIAGRSVGLVYPGANPSLSTLYRVELLNGEQHTRILKPGDDFWSVPQDSSRLDVAAQYTFLGIEHIWIGLDHLLFVACLIFIAGTTRRVIVTITGFTVAHSITLALSALNIVRIATPPVEAVIALSVVFLASEISKARAESLTFRYPIFVSSAFGLLHGFGFAAVLRDIGLPQNALPTALLFFNVGVEIGQILFVIVLIVGFYFLKKLVTAVTSRPMEHDQWRSLTVPASYVIGIVASYWMIERVVGFWAI